MAWEPVGNIKGEPGDVESITPESLGLGNVENTSDADKPISTAMQGALDVKADLVGGKLDPSQAPDVTLSQYLGSVASQSAMLALDGEVGDWCIRSDTSTVFLISGDDPSNISHWQQMAYPPAPVSSVAGKTGAVTLNASDISDVTASASELNIMDGVTATTTELNYVDGVTSAIQTQLDGKAAASHTHNASDINAGTLGIARIPTGTSSSTVCIGNDSRLSDQRTPSDNSVTSAKIVDGTIVNGDINASAAIAKTKLASDVQTSLDKADTSIQASGSATGIWMGATLPGSGTAGILYVVTP